MNKKLYALAILLLTIIPFYVHAEDANDPYSLDHCPQDAAMEQFKCTREKFEILEKDLKDLVGKANNEIKNEWGEKETKADKKSLKLAQEGWLQYRDNQCRHKSPNPSGETPSISFRVTYCLYEKTLERFEEIKRTYFYQGE